MGTRESLQNVYADEMKDLWSANDQMAKVVKAMSEKVHDPKLKHALEKSITDINKHRHSQVSAY
jgi:ferritin-like metal-binding protein YciE